MSSEAIRPSTLAGIKRLAKSLKAEQNIQHNDALNLAAQFSGFQNFKHARNVLLEAVTPSNDHKGHRLFLTVYWHDKESGTKGRETLQILLDTLWSELITPAQLEHNGTLVLFRPEGPDHLASRSVAHSQSRARRTICAAARTFQFMQATGLRPSKGFSRALPNGRSSNVVPGADHYNVWYAPASKRYLITDEPYEAAAEAANSERAAWASRHDYLIAKPLWPGMYNPDGGSRLYVIAHSQKGVPLAPVVTALDKLPPPLVEKDWNGESAPYTPIFVSPGTLGNLNAKNSSPRNSDKTGLARQATVSYVQTFVGTQRRPNARMPIESHAKVGELLKSVLIVSHHRKGVYNRLNSIRCELDEWAQREYNYAELPNEQFFNLYYRESGSSFPRMLSKEERVRHAESLQSMKAILARHYPDSTPLRKLLKTTDAAIKSLECWGD